MTAINSNVKSASVPLDHESQRTSGGMLADLTLELIVAGQTVSSGVALLNYFYRIKISRTIFYL